MRPGHAVAALADKHTGSVCQPGQLGVDEQTRYCRGGDGTGLEDY